MRKSLLLLLMAASVGSGVTFGTFFLGSSDAQEKPDKGPYPALKTRAGLPQPQDPNVSVTFTGAASSPSQKWEYKTIRRSGNASVEAELNALGEDGWELCSTAVAPDSAQIQYILKRPKRLIDAQTKADTLPPSTASQQLMNAWVAGLPKYQAFQLRYAHAAEAAERLKQDFKISSVVYDEQTNTLHVQYKAKDAEGIKRLIEKLDGNTQPEAPTKKGH